MRLLAKPLLDERGWGASTDLRCPPILPGATEPAARYAATTSPPTTPLRRGDARLDRLRSRTWKRGRGAWCCLSCSVSALGSSGGRSASHAAREPSRAASSLRMACAGAPPVPLCDGQLPRTWCCGLRGLSRRNSPSPSGAITEGGSVSAPLPAQIEPGPAAPGALQLATSLEVWTEERMQDRFYRSSI
jgi:hypothetical protein